MEQRRAAIPYSIGIRVPGEFGIPVAFSSRYHNGFIELRRVPDRAHKIKEKHSPTAVEENGLAKRPFEETHHGR
jgi:hypothetical protein